LGRDDIKYGLDVVDRLLKTYGDAPWRQGDLTDSLLVYAAVFIVWSMRGELSGGSPWPPWWPIQSRALSKIVDALLRGFGSLKLSRDDRFEVLGSDAGHRGGHVLVGWGRGGSTLSSVWAGIARDDMLGAARRREVR
jgi:hypothetical protein